MTAGEQKIKTIIFDIDGVLIHMPYYYAVEHKKRYGVDIEEFFHGDFRLTSIGEADLKEVIKPWLKKWGWEKSVDDFLKDWFDFEAQFVNQPMLDLAEKLEAAGYQICLGTEQEHYRFDYLLNSLNFGQYFKHPFYSAGLGVSKHNPRFFERILSELKVPATTVLMIDDKQKILDSAGSVGIRTHLFKDQQNLEKYLNDNGANW